MVVMGSIEFRISSIEFRNKFKKFVSDFVFRTSSFNAVHSVLCQALVNVRGNYNRVKVAQFLFG